MHLWLIWFHINHPPPFQSQPWHYRYLLFDIESARIWIPTLASKKRLTEPWLSYVYSAWLSPATSLAINVNDGYSLFDLEQSIMLHLIQLTNCEVIE